MYRLQNSKNSDYWFADSWLLRLCWSAIESFFYFKLFSPGKSATLLARFLDVAPKQLTLKRFFIFAVISVRTRAYLLERKKIMLFH